LRGAEAQAGLADLLTVVHFGGERLPFRRVQAVLSLACTGGLRCEDVQVELSRSEVSPLDRLRYRFHSVFFEGDIEKPVRVRTEPAARALMPADPGRYVEDDLDRAVAAIVSGSEGPPGLQLLGRDLPPPERDALLWVRELARPSPEEGDSRGLTDTLGRVTRSVRRWAAFTAPGGQAPRWRQALLLLERFADGTDTEGALRSAVLEALNQLHRGAETKRDRLTRHQVDPEGLRDPFRLVLELDLGLEFDAEVRKGPQLPAAVRRWLESAPSEIALVAWPSGQPKETVTLRLDAWLMQALLAVRDGYLFPAALGSYRHDLARFHGRLVTLAVAAGADVGVRIRAEGRAYRIIPADERLRFEGAG
jgi:hypothetical protein